MIIANDASCAAADAAWAAWAAAGPDGRQLAAGACLIALAAASCWRVRDDSVIHDVVARLDLRGGQLRVGVERQRRHIRIFGGVEVPTVGAGLLCAGRLVVRVNASAAPTTAWPMVRAIRFI